MDDIVNDFLIESYEGLDQLDRDLVALESSPTDAELLARIFRAVHTVKGTCGFLGFAKLETVTHAGENLLARLRDGTLAVSPAVTSGLLALVDAMRQTLGSIESSGEEGSANYGELVATLSRLSAAPAEAPAAFAATAPAAASSGPEGSAAAPATKGRKRSVARPRRKRSAAVSTATPEPVGEILVNAGAAERADVLAALQEQAAGDTRRVGEILVDRAAVPPAVVAEALEAQLDGRASVSDSTIRVDVGLLDRLMTQVGELVLARNQILQHATSEQSTSLTAAAQRLDLLTTELQEGVMKTRMQPIGNVWSKFPRVVRDLALSCRKQIRLEMEGKETELDKTIIEAIKDPLTHIVRNSADHGIEMPDERVARGKPAEGLLSLRAYHEGGQVIIEIADDGAGIDADRIRQKAIERGLVSADQAGRMSEREALNLIFLPGLSTATTVTNISGRGVGMDVVKSNIEKIGGAVEIHSRMGEGSTLKIKIPLTLAIIPALVVSCDGDRFAIPQVSVRELVRLDGDAARHAIEMIHGAPVYRLRGRLLPLVHLREALELGSHEEVAAAAGVDFATLRIAHGAWKGKLQAHLDGRLTLDRASLGDATQCALGRWLEQSRSRLGSSASFARLDRAHHALHDAVRAVVESHEHDDRAAASRWLGAVSEHSARVVGELSRWERLGTSRRTTNIVVLNADDRTFGLVVDDINDTEEIVVKPLGKQVKGLAAFAGATIMGDGRVALILDVMGLAQRAHVIAEARDRTRVEQSVQARAGTGNRQTLLVCGLGDTRRAAIPLSSVARLEEFAADDVEQAGAYDVVQYRERILPLLDLPALLGVAAPGARSGMLQVVVYAEHGQSVGFVVGRILDIVEDEVRLDAATTREGMLGSIVVQQRVTDVLDMSAIVRRAAPWLLDGQAKLEDAA